MTIKQAIDIAIVSGMTTFTVASDEWEGKLFEQPVDKIYDFIEGIENEEVLTIYFGSYYVGMSKEKAEGTYYKKPQHCHIIYK